MRHRAQTRKFGRHSAHRFAMMRNLVTSLFAHERVETTDARAKELRRVADRMITLGKRGDLHARRRALRVIRERDVAAKVFDELAERYRSRAGGYTRVVKTRTRVGDAAPLAIVELVEPLEGAGGAKAVAEAPAGRKKARKKAAPAAEAAPKKKAKTAKPAARAASKAAAKPSGKKAAAKPAAKKPPAKKSAGRKTSPKKSG
jgi:large subunit ribosomal protein L17